MNTLNSIVHTKSKSTITFDINSFKNFLSRESKILSLDASKNMIGTALSDDRRIVALSHVLIERAKLESDFKKINLIIHNNNVDAIVIGLPLNKNGTKGRQAQSVITFASNLNKKIGLPILMWDERFSTEGIQREMLNNGLKKKNIKKHIDCASATWVLQGVLDRINYNNNINYEE
tara:strand:+ start:1345 stop:1872 length:528 start_codon:yes stop_codon:yes gene_type:complete